MRFVELVAVLSCLLFAQTALAGRVYVKGEVLEGRVESVSPEGLAFRTEYGSGDITIAWADLEKIDSDREMVLAYGDEGEFATGRVLAVDGDDILFGSDSDSAIRVPIASIYGGFDQEAWDNSLLTRLRARYRHWEASLAVSGSTTQAATNSQSLQIDLDVARRKDKTRVLFEGNYLVADSEDEIDDEKDQISKRVFTQLRGEHDIIARGYVFGTQSFEWDKVNDLKARVIPRVGVGYRVIEQEWGFVAAEIAPAFIYEAKRDDCNANSIVGVLPGPTPSCGQFEDDPDNPGQIRQDGRRSTYNNYWALSMGGRSEATLPYGSKITASVDYFPNVEDWGSYLVRARSVFTLPVLDWVSLRISLDNTYDSEAPDDARNNRLTGAIGLAATF
jgi:hypothetical protein